MKAEIRNEPLHYELYGYGEAAVQKDYMGTAFRLMDKLWKTVKAEGLKTKGINIWVYEPNEQVFVGVELEGPPPLHTDLTPKTVDLSQYAYYKHIGPYQLIRQVGQTVRDELIDNGYEMISPYLEVYGHWSEDENKLETELIWGVGVMSGEL